MSEPLAHFKFSDTTQRDLAIKALYPKRECGECPEEYNLPNGNVLVVFLDEAWEYEGLGNCVICGEPATQIVDRKTHDGVVTRGLHVCYQDSMSGPEGTFITYEPGSLIR